ncbi:DUF4192 domain-containing protein [Gordonia sputi]
MDAHISSSVAVTPQTLLTAVPGLLGFVPRRSLVWLVFENKNDGCVKFSARVDFERDADGEPLPAMAAAVRRLAEVSRRGENGPATPVVAVVVDERLSRDDVRHRRWMREVASDAETQGCALHAGFVVAAVTEGERWSTVWGPECGVWSGLTVGDPFTSPTAVAAAVRHGKTVARDREHIGPELSPEPCSCGRCGTDTEAPIADVTAAVRAVYALLDRASITCGEAESVGRTIRHLDARDALLTFAASDRCNDAERLWTSVARQTQGAARASAATMLAHLYYLHGEGAVAGLMLDAALNADPEWSFARLLDMALQNGMRPEYLWQLVDDSVSALTRCGVEVSVIRPEFC